MTTYYKKNVSAKGKVSYEPVKEYDSELMDSFPHGSHLVVCKKGSSSRIYNIDPALAPMLAAAKLLQDEMVSVLLKASEYKPPAEPLTEEQKEAWDNMSKAFGGLSVIYGPSMAQVAEEVTNTLMKQTEVFLTNPALKKAWENFKIISELSK